MSHHTPGPWLSTGGKSPSISNFDFSVSIAAVKTPKAYGGPSNLEETSANASLIAAAPEMLEAIKWLAEFCCIGDHDRKDPEIAKIWAAIEKAEGRL